MYGCGFTYWIIIIIWIGVQFRALPPGSTAAIVADCTISRFLNVPTLAARSLSRPQPAVTPSSQELWARNSGQMVPGICTQDSFTCHKFATWDRQFYFPSEERRAEDFLSPFKNPTASAGYATSAPPKPQLPTG